MAKKVDSLSEKLKSIDMEKIFSILKKAGLQDRDFTFQVRLNLNDVTAKTINIDAFAPNKTCVKWETKVVKTKDKFGNTVVKMQPVCVQWS